MFERARDEHDTTKASSSKNARCTVAEFAIFSVHRTNQSARLADIPMHLERSMSSKPTQTSVSPPQVLCHERGTPSEAQRTKKNNKPQRHSGQPHSRRIIVSNKHVPRGRRIPGNVLQESTHSGRDSRPAKKTPTRSQMYRPCSRKHHLQVQLGSTCQSSG